jgi:hypothetical protein
MLVPARVLPLIILAAASCSLGACSSTQPRVAKQEDSARLLAPVPACVTTLPGRGSAPAGMSRSLRDEYWKIVFPAFEEQTHRLPSDTLTCTGRAILHEPAFQGATAVQQADANAITLGGGADGIKAAWLRSHVFGDGTTAGALALVRARDDSATVIAVGAYRGRQSARLSLERLGAELLLLVQDDGCVARTSTERCDSTLTIYLVRQGALAEAARVTLEQIDFDTDSEPPNRGRFRYHLTTSPSFEKSSFRLIEHVSVTDPTGREIRWAELERDRQIADDRLHPSDVPLWARMYRSRADSQGKGP